jgi:acyl-CoA hydrolase
LLVHECAKTALEVIESNMSLLVHGGMATPSTLLEGLKEHAYRLENVELLHLHTHGDAFYADKSYEASFRVTNFFVGGNVRKHLDYNRVDYLPCFLSEIPNLIKSGNKKVNVALIQVSPPNKHGFCSLGTSVDIMKAGVEAADIVIAQVNTKMPTIHGDGIIHVSQIDHAIFVDEPLHHPVAREITEDEKRIGQFIAGIIEDGSTLQMGIGSIPDAVLNALTTHKDLGIHTEMYSDGAIDLLERGVVNNKKKKFHQGKSVSSFLMGSQKLVDYVDNNPSTILLGADYVNNPRNIARNPKVVAINSAIEVDLTGQVCADSLGHQIYSGVGGQMDFIRGASLSEGGKPIIALLSQTGRGHSKISACLKPGAGVVTTRAHIHYVVTENGVANLYGKSLHERAKALIEIAHPDHRENLEREWFNNYCK